MPFLGSIKTGQPFGKTLPYTLRNLLGATRCNGVPVLAVLAFGVGLSAATAPSIAAEDAVEFLDQGWSDEIRQLYYFTPQGSLLIPLQWFLALETPQGTGPFVDRKYLETFGWIFDDSADPKLNPEGLPIGFATDPVVRPEGQWTGLTCAACHTSEVLAGDTRIRIDGGPAKLDFASFHAALAEAVHATAAGSDPARFDRFAAAVLGAYPAPGAIDALREALALYEVRLSGDAALRHSPVAPGFGRIDALNQIANALSVKGLGAVSNLRLANAPASYPQLWLTPKLEWVEWNPVASSPLGRNVGEVLGVFGTIDLQIGPNLFSSSVLLSELIALENWIDDLKSPPWPATQLGPIDLDKAETGRDLFKEDCAGCHNMPPFEMTKPGEYIADKSFIKVGRIPSNEIGSDPMYEQSFLSRTALTGQLAAPLFGGKAVVQGPDFLPTVVGSASRHKIDEAGLSVEEMLAANDFRFLKPTTENETLRSPDPRSPPCELLDCLKASPLLGAWATGPFLHNGSVPTIYELLSAPDQRRAVFWTGDIHLDPERLGFVSDEAPGLFRYDTQEQGNANTGHVFPRDGYSEQERMAVIEYLKHPNYFAPEPHF